VILNPRQFKKNISTASDLLKDEKKQGKGENYFLFSLETGKKMNKKLGTV
jgi:hypothetical protein